MSFTFMFIALLGGLFYGVRFAGLPNENPQKALVKTIAMIALTLAAMVAGAHILIVFAFVFSALGDYFLAIKDERGLLAGLSAFALAHICFSIFFFSQADEVPLLVLTLFAIYFVGLIASIWGYLDHMRIPVVIYGAILTLMAVLAFATALPVWLKIGVCLFVFSDSLIALEKFSPYFDGLNGKGYQHGIWWSYLAAQLLIAYAVLI